MIENAYALLDMLLPYQWLAHAFMKNALLAILLVTPLFGLLGKWIGFDILPVYLLAFIVLMLIMTEATFRITAKKDAPQAERA